MDALPVASPLEMLPDVDLIGRGHLTRFMRARDFATYREVARAVWELPYGRTASKGPRAIFVDGRGTCSTKHAFLYELAGEQYIRINLVLAFYEMTEANTPGVGPVLAAHGVDAVLEAHCFLCLGGNAIDLTLPPGASEGQPKRFLSRQLISAGDIGPHKVTQHKLALAAWLKARPHLRYSMEEMWRIREECIARLST